MLDRGISPPARSTRCGRTPTRMSTAIWKRSTRCSATCGPRWTEGGQAVAARTCRPFRLQASDLIEPADIAETILNQPAPTSRKLPIPHGDLRFCVIGASSFLGAAVDALLQAGLKVASIAGQSPWHQPDGPMETYLATKGLHESLGGIVGRLRLPFIPRQIRTTGRPSPPSSGPARCGLLGVGADHPDQLSRGVRRTGLQHSRLEALSRPGWH